jgi:hypothetical protein
MAWTLGTPLIAYRDDIRTKIAGRMNPLLAGLVDFTTVDCVKDLPAALIVECQRTKSRPIEIQQLPAKFQTAIQRGAELWKALGSERAFGENNIIADCVTSLFAPSSHHKPWRTGPHKQKT